MLKKFIRVLQLSKDSRYWIELEMVEATSKVDAANLLVQATKELPGEIIKTETVYRWD